MSSGEECCFPLDTTLPSVSLSSDDDVDETVVLLPSIVSVLLLIWLDLLKWKWREYYVIYGLSYNGKWTVNS